MKSEVKIILPPEDPENKKGGVFESMIRSIIHLHDYEIEQNVNFTGLEVDLIAKHNIRKTEKLYVECKAKEKPGATEIRNFAFNAKHKKASYAYFIHTTELEHQAAGLKTEIEESDDVDYKKLTFIGPTKIIEILTKSEFIQPFVPKQVKGKQITKRILALTYVGKYYIYIYVEDALPVSFFCIDADDPTKQINTSDINILKERIIEISDLDYIPSRGEAQKLSKKTREVETISEVATGEAWYDYKPTNPQFFVGRDSLIKDIVGFFSDVSQKKTERRIFYLEGKSGWGKSSLVARIRNKANSGHNKKKYFVYAVDYRSALSNNFASIAFSKMVEKAVNENFLPKRMFKGKLKITSPLDVISSPEVHDLLDYLSREDKVLVLVFDQFEDAFRQGTLFASFYKLLLDTHDARSNLIIGFSWKSEINIPADHEAYYLWQQAKTNAIEMKMPEFSIKDLRAVTKQLEQEIGLSLPGDLKSKLIEISQGFPWLIKKLCIHVYEQVKAGISPEQLFQEDMNIEDLFRQDLEKLDPKESEMLSYIAKRAYEGRQFDISETDEHTENTIKGLIDKRLVIKSGTKHNIYWDIFRDYIVEGQVPEIGEIYLLRSTPQKVYENLKIIREKELLSINEIERIDKKERHHGTYQNYFRIMKDLGIISTQDSKLQKYDDDRKYSITESQLSELSEESFKSFINNKFQKYAPVLRLHKSTAGKIVPFHEAQEIITNTFRGRGFSSETIHTYTQTLSAWLQYCNYPIKIESLPRGNSNGSRSDDPKDRFLTNYPKTLNDYFYKISNSLPTEVSNSRKAKIESDLVLLEILKSGHRKKLLNKEYIDLDEERVKNILKEKVSSLIPIQKVLELYEKWEGKITGTLIISELPELFINANSPEYKKTLSNVLRGWSVFIKSEL